MLKQGIQDNNNYAKIVFERDNNYKKDEEGAFFLEFNYISMAFIAKGLKYKMYRLLQKQITGDRQELFCSNDRFGKSPLYFNPAYLLKKFLNKHLPIFFEFHDKNGIIGEFLLDKKAYEQIKLKPLTVSLYDSKNINFGDFKITYASMPNNHFLDYLNHGLDFNLIFGIDYTSSNKDPMNPQSLHTLIGDGNVYEKAIRACGGNLAFYDKSQAFPVFGFGGIPKGKNSLSHCFNINGTSNPNILGGLDNVIKSYKESLKEVKLLGPTRFSELIQTVLDNTIKYRHLIEQDEIMQKNHKMNISLKNELGQFRSLVNSQIKNANLNSKQSHNRSTTVTPTPNRMLNIYASSESVSKTKNSETYSPNRKPFNCPSVRDFSSHSIQVSPRGQEDEDFKFQRPTVSKKAIRNTIFKEHEEVDKNEEKNFIVPKTERNYAILLILTDGKIDDMVETKNILVQASSYPISVIIIGVGDNNFGNMIELRKLFYFYIFNPTYYV